jgi:hypothetical protein
MPYLDVIFKVAVSVGIVGFVILGACLLLMLWAGRP